MAVRIELWTNGRIADGVDEWWDDMESWLPDDTPSRYPLLDLVDPYGDVVLHRDELAALRTELEAFMGQAPESLRQFITKLIALCETGLVATDSELRFLGD